MQISNLIKDNILSFGIEYGNCFGTYSSMDESIAINRKNTINTFLNKKNIIIDESRELKNNILNRKIHFIPNEDIKLYDMVSRFLIITNSDKPAMINGILISNKGSDQYHQYPVEDAKIPINENFHLEFKNKNNILQKNFNDLIYIRDTKESKDGRKQWILHHRLIAKSDQELKLVFCTRFYNKTQNIIDGLCPRYIKKKLFRIRETTHPNSPIMSISQTKLNKNEKMEINTSITLSNEIYY